MVEFAIALMGKLELINTHSFNSFKLRIGEFILDLYWWNGQGETFKKDKYVFSVNIYSSLPVVFLQE